MNLQRSSFRNVYSQERRQLLKDDEAKVLGEAKPSITVPLLVFSDETSGNTTKKWNRLENFSMSLAGLPRKEIRKVENIHFLAASNVVPSVPLGKSIAGDLKGA
jgi:hypothetical protein